mmetsp:Transcript_4608/g.29207  ORF Transcript_4608/g.29207 Transcript_4608/m.29207 type:complete len:268 (-) Transcript_4608:236-1039(-)
MVKTSAHPTAPSKENSVERFAVVDKAMDLRPLSKVFFNNMAMVMGPTPPGTGVSTPATSLTPSKSTSPTNLYPVFFVASSTAFVPTSITAAPGFTQCFFTRRGEPAPAMTMSASFTMRSMNLVLEWQMVTVASSFTRSMAAGMPTMLERPMTTACLPAMGTLQRLSSSMHPNGVHGVNSGSLPFMDNVPVLMGWKPSTSFWMLISDTTFSSSMCLGNGSWTRMPCTAGLALSWRTFRISSSSVIVSGRSSEIDAMPTSAHAFLFILT